MIFCHPNIKAHIGSFQTGDDFGSQHNFIKITVPLKAQYKRKVSNQPDFKKANWEKFKEILDENLPNPSEVHVKSTDDMDTLNDKITIAIEMADKKAIPRKLFKFMMFFLTEYLQNNCFPN